MDHQFPRVYEYVWNNVVAMRSPRLIPSAVTSFASCSELHTGCIGRAGGKKRIGALLTRRSAIKRDARAYCSRLGSKEPHGGRAVIAPISRTVPREFLYLRERGVFEGHERGVGRYI